MWKGGMWEVKVGFILDLACIAFYDLQSTVLSIHSFHPPNCLRKGASCLERTVQSERGSQDWFFCPKPVALLLYNSTSLSWQQFLVLKGKALRSPSSPPWAFLRDPSFSFLLQLGTQIGEGLDNCPRSHSEMAEFWRYLPTPFEGTQALTWTGDRPAHCQYKMSDKMTT